MASPISNTSACDAAIVFADRSAAAGLRDRLNQTQQIDGDRFVVRAGWVQGADRRHKIVTAVPVSDAAPDYQRLLTALHAAHHARTFIGAGFADALTPQAADWRRLVANEARLAGNPQLDLASPIHQLPSASIGPFEQAKDRLDDLPQNVIATTTWCYDFAVACVNLRLERAIVAVARPSDEPSVSNEVKNVEQQSQPAGAAGALLRLAWRRPTEIGRLWRRQERTWEGQERLADALVASLDLLAEGGGTAS